MSWYDFKQTFLWCFVLCTDISILGINIKTLIEVNLYEEHLSFNSIIIECLKHLQPSPTSSILYFAVIYTCSKWVQSGCKMLPHQLVMFCTGVNDYSSCNVVLKSGLLSIVWYRLIGGEAIILLKRPLANYSSLLKFKCFLCYSSACSKLVVKLKVNRKNGKKVRCTL